MADQNPFKIDQINLYEKLGHDKIVSLSTAFYNRVFEDTDDEEFWNSFGRVSSYYYYS